MKETDIRNRQLMEENAVLRRSDLRYLLGFRREFVAVACPACAAVKSKVWFKKQGFIFHRCSSCRSVYISPRPSLKLLNWFYSKGKSIVHWNDKIFPVSEVARRKHIFRPRVKRVIDLCLKYRVPQGMLVDVGAGFGTFGEEVNKRRVFDRVVAVEPAPSLAATCRQKGLEVIEKLVEQVRDVRADVVTNFELIEHLFSPYKFLQACRRMLKPEGLLILTTPNVLGFDLQVLGKYSDHLSGPNHLNYFHPESLSTLMERSGFKMVEILTPGKLDVDVVRQKLQRSPKRIKVDPWIGHVLWECGEKTVSNLQDFLVKNLLSSHMWVVGRRK